jgi:hypothetical protein
MRCTKAILFMALTQLTVSAQRAEPLDRLRAHALVDPVTRVASIRLAGRRYTSTSKEVGRSFLRGDRISAPEYTGRRSLTAPPSKQQATPH